MRRTRQARREQARWAVKVDEVLIRAGFAPRVHQGSGLGFNQPVVPKGRYSGLGFHDSCVQPMKEIRKCPM